MNADDGLTLRDSFAALAMQGFFAADRHGRIMRPDFPAVAETAYLMADAMLAERNKNEETS